MRVTQLVTETLAAPTSTALRVTQLVIEVLTDDTPVGTTGTGDITSAASSIDASGYTPMPATGGGNVTSPASYILASGLVVQPATGTAEVISAASSIAATGTVPYSGTAAITSPASSISAVGGVPLSGPATMTPLTSRIYALGRVGETGSGITLTIAGVDRTDYLAINSGRITRDLNGRARFNGVLRQVQRGYSPAKGDEIIVKKDNKRWFAGNIFRIVLTDAGGSTNLMEFSIDCVDFNHIANRRLITADWTGQYFYTIVEGITVSGMNGENVTLGNVTNPGPLFTEKVVFKYEPCATAFNKLATITGYQWYIDFYKDLHFASFAGTLASFSITDSSGNWADLEIERSDEDYRNRQYVRSEYNLSKEFNDSFTVVQEGQDFIPLTSGIDELIGVTVNGVTVTTYIDPWDGNPPSGYNFYYVVGWPELFTYGWTIGDPSQGYVLHVGDVVAVNYKSKIGNVVMVEDTPEQTSRNQIWEAIEEQRWTDDGNTLEAIGLGRLRQFSNDTVKARWTMPAASADPEPGQYVTVNVTRFGVNQLLLIERVDTKWIAGLSGDVLEHTVQATSAEPYGRSQAYFEKVVEMARIGPQFGDLSAGFVLAETIEGLDNPGLSVGVKQPVRTASKAGKCSRVTLYFRSVETVLTTAPIEIDIYQNGTSIFAPAGHIIFPAGSRSVAVVTTFRSSPLVIAQDDKITFEIITADSKAKDGFLNLYVVEE